MSEEKKTEAEKEIQLDPQPKQKTPEEKVVPEETKKETPSEDVKPASDSEVAWESLAGPTQNRVRELVKRAKDAESRNASISNTIPPQGSPEPAGSEAPSPAEIKEAIDKLRGYGVATTDDLEVLKGRLFIDTEHQRLIGKYSGDKNLPKYDSVVVEDYARTHGYGGNLEAAYRDIFHDEILDAEVKSRKPAKSTYTEKPTASVKIGEKPLTVTSLRERLAKSDGHVWWAKNRDKIEPLLEKMSQG